MSLPGRRCRRCNIHKLHKAGLLQIVARAGRHKKVCVDQRISEGILSVSHHDWRSFLPGEMHGEQFLPVREDSRRNDQRMIGR